MVDPTGQTLHCSSAASKGVSLWQNGSRSARNGDVLPPSQQVTWQNSNRSASKDISLWQNGGSSKEMH